MQDGPSSFALLKDFAREASSEKRRELLRRATDALLAGGYQLTRAEGEAFDEIVGAVAADLSVQVRAELARAIAAAPFQRTARQLAFDAIEVAKPVIERSTALTETDLLELIAEKSQDHMMAITRRPDITEPISSGLVKRGGDPIVASLLGNQTAKIATDTYGAVAERAQDSAILHAPFVRRKGVPLHLLNEVYLKVEPALRREILRNYENVSPAELDQAFAKGRKQLAKAYLGLPADYLVAKRRIEYLDSMGDLVPPLLVRLLREGKGARTAFLLAFSRLADVSFNLVERLIDDTDLDGIALLCRASGFDRAVFVTLAMLIIGGDRRMSKVEAYGQLYKDVPLTAAQRAVRFWKVRDAQAA